MIREGDWVRVKTTGDVGVAERFFPEGKVFVRIPTKTNWPFPKWETVHVNDLRKAREPKPPKTEHEYEDALL
jgi:hypothetical protein